MCKKIVSIALIFIMLINISACKGEKAPEDVAMPAPDSLDKDVPVTTLDSGVTLYDGYLCKLINGEYNYYPYVENKIDGVIYVDDEAYANDAESKYFKNKKKLVKEYNMPDGCDISKKENSQCWGFGTYNPGTPEFADVERTEEGEKARALYIHRNYTSFAGKSFAGQSRADGDGIFSTSEKLRDIDVQAVSFAFYEDFYEELPQFTLEIYAVTKELARQKLGDTYKLGEANAIIDNYSKDYSGLEPVVSKKMDRTGVYYIDWKAIDANEDYLFYIIVLDWDKVSDCAYCMYGDNLYDIVDEAAYSEWKKANRDRFIAG